MKIALVLFFVACLPRIDFSQVNENEKLFSIFVSGGTSINQPINWYFYAEEEYSLITPGVYGNLGIEYGPINFYELSQLFFSVSSAYTNVFIENHKLESENGSVNLEIETVPILFWIKLQGESKLSPFIEAGIGISKLNFKEEYSISYIDDTSFEYWSFAYGFGAGLNYTLNSNFDFSLAVHLISNEKENIINVERFYRTGIWMRNVVMPISFRVNIKVL